MQNTHPPIFKPLLLVCLCALMLSACGQTGPLKLADQDDKTEESSK